MRIVYFSFSVLLGITLAAGAAHARSAFFVQVGAADTHEEAEQKWEKLRGAYPGLLDALEFAPRTVLPSGGGAAEYRVQAGPARSREQAQRICSNLNKKDVECFIVETAVFAGEVSYPKTASRSGAIAAAAKPEAPAPEPVAPEPVAPEHATAPAAGREHAALETPPLPEAAPSEAAAAEPKEPEGLFPWLADLFSSSSDAEPSPAPTVATAEPSIAEAPAELAAPTGEVAVAEAIPVPVSAEVKPVPLEQRAVDAPAMQAPLLLLETQAATWLQISGFTNEQHAYDFSQALREQTAEQGKLRMRIIKPVSRRGQRVPVALTVGPLARAEQFAAICAFAAEQNTGLRCGDGASRAAPVHAGPAAYPPRTSAGGMRAVAAPPRDFTPPAAASRFYVQLGSWRSKAEAVRRWESLQAAHEELLAGQPHEIRSPRQSSVGARPSFRLRTGPYVERGSASALCGSLSGRGVSCVVVGE